MRRQLPTSNISTSRNDVLFHVTGVLPAIEILKTGAIKCSKPSAWERADGAKLNYVAFTRTLTSEFLKAARVRGPLVIFRLDGRFPATPTPTLPLTPADWPKLSWPSVCKALHVQSISDACETLSEIWRVRNQLLRLRARGQELPDNPNYSRVAAAMQW